MTTTYTVRMPNDAVVTFSVQGDVVQVYAHDRMVSGSYGRAAARVVWASLIRQGGVRFTCHDEDGHDGEPCTCSERSRYEPQPGTYAYTARLLAQSGLMSGEEADRWKDEMKEGGY